MQQFKVPSRNFLVVLEFPDLLAGLFDDKVEDRLQINLEVFPIEQGNKHYDILIPRLKFCIFEFYCRLVVLVQIEYHHEDGLLKSKSGGIIQGADNLGNHRLIIFFQ
jgi:hypothetical protein